MTQRMTSMQPEWLRELLEPLTRRDVSEIPDRVETGDGGVLLTDLQRAALRWLSSLD